MSAAYYWPPDNSRARAAALAPWGASGLFLPLWPDGHKVWTFAGGTFVSGVPALDTKYGFAAAASDTASGVWAVQSVGALLHYAADRSITTYAAPSGKIYNGCAFSPQYNIPYVAAGDGTLYAGSAMTPVTSGFPPGVSWGLALSGSTLFAIGSGVLNTCTLSASAVGASGATTYPLKTASCLAASTAASAVALGGWNCVALASGYSHMAFSPASPVMVAVSGNTAPIDLYLGTGDAWSRAVSVTGIAGAAAGAWVPGGSSVLLCDPVGGTVRAFNYAFGNLTLAQTLNLPGASAVAMLPSGAGALVCQAAQNQIVPLSLVGAVWVSGAPVAVANPTSIIPLSENTAAVGSASGLTMLTRSTAWAVSGSLSLPYVPAVLAAAASGIVLAAGSSGPSGYFSAASGVTGLFTYSWPGSGSGMIYDQGQAVVADPASNLFWCFGNLFTQYQLIFTIIPTAPVTRLAVSSHTPYSTGGTIFGMGGATTPLFQFTSPYNVEPLRSGAVSVLTSGGWATAALGSGHVPTALAFDASGRVWAATQQNDLYSVGLNGVVLSQRQIAQFAGQAQNAPLGISALAFVGSGLYAASSLAGVLSELL